MSLFLMTSVAFANVEATSMNIEDSNIKTVVVPINSSTTNCYLLPCGVFCFECDIEQDAPIDEIFDTLESVFCDDEGCWDECDPN